MKISVNLRGLFFALYMLLSLPLIIGLMYLFRGYHRVIRRLWARISSALNGVKIVVEGTEDPTARMLVANHESMWDIIALEAVHQNNLCWIAKQQITNIPLYGHIMKAPRMISVDREDKKGLLRLISEAKECLNDDRVLAIFPEGTRTQSPGHLLPFKGGAAMIADKHALRVQPVVILGSGTILPAHTIAMRPGTIRIIYLPSLDAAEAAKGWLEGVREEMQKTISSRF